MTNEELLDHINAATGREYQSLEEIPLHILLALNCALLLAVLKKEAIA